MWKGEPQNDANKNMLVEDIGNNNMNSFRRLIRVCTVCRCPTNRTLGMNGLTHRLLIPSADNLCKQFGPRSGPTNVGPDLGPNCLTL